MTEILEIIWGQGWFRRSRQRHGSIKKIILKISQYSLKNTYVLESLFHNVTGLTPTNSARFLRTPILKDICQRQPSIGVLIERCSENIQQIYRGTPMPKCDFSKFVKELYWNYTSTLVFCCIFSENFFPKNTSRGLL